MKKKQTTFTIDEILACKFNSTNNQMYLLHEVSLTGGTQVNYDNREGLVGCVEAFNIADLITEKLANQLGDDVEYCILLYKGFYFLSYELYIDDEHIDISLRNINGMTPQYSIIIKKLSEGKYLFYTILADKINFTPNSKMLPR